MSNSESSYSMSQQCTHPLLQTYLDFIGFKKASLPVLLLFQSALISCPSFSLSSSHFHHFLSVPQLNYSILDLPDSSDKVTPLIHSPWTILINWNKTVGPAHFSYGLWVCFPLESCFCHSYFVKSSLFHPLLLEFEKYYSLHSKPVYSF